MKKLSALLLAFLTILSLAACGGGNDTPDPSPTKAWNYTYNNAQYNISIALSSGKYVEMTVTAYN